MLGMHVSPKDHSSPVDPWILPWYTIEPPLSKHLSPRDIVVYGK